MKGSPVIAMNYLNLTSRDRGKLFLIPRDIFSPVAVTTSHIFGPYAPSLNPPGRERLAASWTGFPSFHTYSTSDLAHPSRGREFEDSWVMYKAPIHQTYN